MTKNKLIVPIKELRYVCNPEDFSFKDTSQVEPVKGLIGQDRAVEAITFGLEIDHPEYNIFATGYTGRGKKKTVLREFLERFAEERAASGHVSLRDICCVYNFENPDQPKIVFLEKGCGREFKRRMETLLRGLKKEISAIFQLEGVAEKNSILRDIEKTQRRLMNNIRKQSEEAGWVLSQGPDGFSLSNSKYDEGYDDLPEEERAVIEERQRNVGKLIQEASREIRELNREADQKIDALEKSLIEKFIGSLFEEFEKEYSAFPKVKDYLEQLQKYILFNARLFNSAENHDRPSMSFDPAGMDEEDISLPFMVNILVDNYGKNAAPVIFENNPSFDNLFCRIEKEFSGGDFFTDHTRLKAGSICQADGGYLILNARDILENPGVWQKLKKTLRQRFLEFEEPFNVFGITSAINPEPLPLNLKVVVVGEPELYHLLIEYDPDFLSVFKVKAEFDSKMPLTDKARKNYAGFISLCCQEESLPPFDSAAVAKIVEYGARLAGNQAELSTEFDEIKDLIIESGHWAKKSGSPLVQSEHIGKAIASQKLRVDLAEEKIRASIKNEIFLIDVREKKVGQINGLSVYNLGDHSFGTPFKITVRTFAGNKGLISIQREVKMSGPNYDKGILILRGYFGEKYGKRKTISFSASLCFEQLYGGVEGDSASAAELFCLISSLAELGINQGIAVTGSVNQHGEIQPIGGVNQKIEGFFDVCKEKGLTRDQGVIIPCQNIKNLMLREDIVEAVRNGDFHIYFIKTIDEGFEILMDTSSDKVHEKVKSRLGEMINKK